MATHKPTPAVLPTADPADRRVGEPAGTPGAAAAFGAVSGVLALGLVGALIGWGIVDTGCSGDCPRAAIWGALAGAAMGAVGAAIISVVVLRARFLWRVPRAPG